MKTTVTNKRVRELLTSIGDGTLVPRPEFQRRLVWAMRHKVAFIKTVLEGYPFPEVYIASGDVDLETGWGNLMLVDGQQRLTTLYDYFHGSNELRLRDVIRYEKLDNSRKKAFLEYEVVVRDLGAMEIDQIKEVFKRINSTSCALNAMEIDNARYDGELKRLAEELSQEQLFEDANFFSPNEVRRMNDLRFVLSLIVTMMSQYFNRDEEMSSYLERYNDEFREYDTIKERFLRVVAFVRQFEFPSSSRFWKKADFFTAFVEIDYLLNVKKLTLEARPAREALEGLYERVDRLGDTTPLDGQSDFTLYARAALQATNDRSNRVTRGRIVRELLSSSSSARSVAAK